MLVNTRFGPKKVTVNRTNRVTVKVQGIPEWFVFSVNLENGEMVFTDKTKHGRFVGETIKTTAGNKAVFSYNGRQYSDDMPIAAFAKLAVSEL